MLSQNYKQSYKQEIYDYYLGKHIEEQEFIKSLNFQQINRQFQEWWGDNLPKNLSEPILDLGCGWGGWLKFLSDKGYENLTGIDASPQQVSIAQSLGLTNVKVGDIFSALDEHDSYYSCISAFNLLEHLDKEQVLPFLKLIHKALKPGGILLLEIPNSNSIFGGRTRYWDFTHELSFCPTSVQQILSVTGFLDIKFRERSPVVHGVKSFVRYYCWQMIRLILSFYLIIEQGAVKHNIFTQDMHTLAIK